jgi:hypothetical protein
MCDDENECTDDTCNSATGCVYTPKICIDNDVCTKDSCDPALGCKFSPILASRPVIPPFVDVGCSTAWQFEGNVPEIGTGFWRVVDGVAGLSLTNPENSTVIVSGITQPFRLRYTISFFTCSHFSADISVKRYSEVSPAVTPDSLYIACQASTLLNASDISDGFGRWSRIEGVGNLNEGSITETTATVTSLSELSTRFQWTVSAINCVSKDSVLELTRAAANSTECVGCVDVQTGANRNGTATFFSTCDPPIPLEIVDTEQEVVLPDGVKIASLLISEGARVKIDGELSLADTLVLDPGATLSLTANSSVVQLAGDLTSSARIVLLEGNLTIQGNFTLQAGSAFEISEAGSCNIAENAAFEGDLNYEVKTEHVCRKLGNERKECAAFEGRLPLSKDDFNQAVASRDADLTLVKAGICYTLYYDAPSGTSLKSFDGKDISHVTYCGPRPCEETGTCADPATRRRPEPRATVVDATIVSLNSYSYVMATPIVYNSHSGALNSMVVTIPDAACERVVSSTPVYGSSGLSVLLTVDPDQECLDSRYGAATASSGLSVGVIIGIVCGSVAAVVLAVIVLVVVGKRVRTRRMEVMFAAKEASNRRHDVELTSVSTIHDDPSGAE